jgi:hypothetical protein
MNFLIDASLPGCQDYWGYECFVCIRRFPNWF